MEESMGVGGSVGATVLGKTFVTPQWDFWGVSSVQKFIEKLVSAPATSGKQLYVGHCNSGPRNLLP